MRKKKLIFIPLTLGLLTAFGPFITDFYLPVLPEMTDFFHTSPSLVSMSLTAGMFGLAAGQIFIGPLTDKYGRRWILIGSMILFTIASLLCIFSPDIMIFNAMRLLQGIAGAGGIVISKSMATDMYSGRELARFMALLAAINGIVPICAPVIGGLMAGIAAWQGTFTMLIIVGMALLTCSCFLHETLPVEKRITGSVIRVYGNLFKVFLNPRFTLSTISFMACFFCFFSYISSSPFILQNLYGLSPFHFSLCFGMNAVIVGVSAVLSIRIKQQYWRLVSGSIAMVAGTLCLSAALVLKMPLISVLTSYVILMVGFGLLESALTATALDSERSNAGAASAIFGASGFVAGAVVSPLVALGRIEVSASIVMCTGAVVCLLLVLPLFRSLKRTQA